MITRCPECKQKQMKVNTFPVEGSCPTLYETRGICSCGYETKPNYERWEGLTK